MARETVRTLADDLSDAVTRADYQGERVVVKRRGRKVAALIPFEEYEFLERVIEKVEDTRDDKAIRAFAVALEKAGGRVEDVTITLDEAERKWKIA